MWTVRGQQHPISTQERRFLRKCQGFWYRKCLDLSGIRTPNPRSQSEWSSRWSYQTQTFTFPCFNTGSGGIDIFVVKLTFEMLTGAGNSIHFRTTNRCSCEMFLDRNYLDQVSLARYLNIFIIFFFGDTTLKGGCWAPCLTLCIHQWSVISVIYY